MLVEKINSYVDGLDLAKLNQSNQNTQTISLNHWY